MPIVVVSLHERDAPLELLDRLAVSVDEVPKALARLGDSPHLSERVVLSTCMRTEIYAVAERFHDGLADIQRFFEDRLPDSPSDLAALAEALFVEFDEPAARHLFEVASGIDSPVLGEGEVLRQVRDAHERARAEGATGPILDGLFRHALEVGKRARTETAIAKGTTSLAHVAVELAAKHLGGSFDEKRVVVVGAGEMGESLVSALSPLVRRAKVVVANRSADRAVELAKGLQGRGVPLDTLGAELVDADVVFSATAASEVLLTAEDLRRARTGGHRGALLIVDAAMPRDFDPGVAQLPGVSLLDVDDLRAYAEREIASRRAEIDHVAEIINYELERYALDARSRDVAPLVTALRSRAEDVRGAELARVAGAMSAMSDEQRATVEQLTKRIVAKLVHDPTVALKQQAGTPKGERLSEALRTLFGL
ncbi:MAG: glutamyl-tRNA reductase [Acidimicrobiales bacterium]